MHIMAYLLVKNEKKLFHKSSAEIFTKLAKFLIFFTCGMANSVDPYQIASKGAV